MTSQGTAHGRFQRAIHARHVQNAEMAAREMGGLSLADALALCEQLVATDPKRYERAALRWLQRFIDERLPPIAEVALAAAALAELRHGRRAVGANVLKELFVARREYLVRRLSLSRCRADISRVTPQRRARKINRSLCALAAAAASVGALSAVASADPGSNCPPGNHYGFACVSASSGVPPVAPAPAPAPSDPTPSPA